MFLFASFLGLAHAVSPTCTRYPTIGGKVVTACDGLISTDIGQMSGGDPVDWIASLPESLLADWDTGVDQASPEGSLEVGELLLDGQIALPLAAGTPTGDIAALLHADLSGDGVEEAILAVVSPQGDGSYALWAAVDLGAGRLADPSGDPDLIVEATVSFSTTGYTLVPLPAWWLERWSLSTGDGDLLDSGAGGLLSWGAEFGPVAHEAIALLDRGTWTVSDWSLRTGDQGARESLSWASLGSAGAWVSHLSTLDTASSDWSGALSGVSTTAAWAWTGLAEEQSLRGSTTRASSAVVGTRGATWTSTNGGAWVYGAGQRNPLTPAPSLEADAAIVDLLGAVSAAAASTRAIP